MKSLIMNVLGLGAGATMHTLSRYFNFPYKYKECNKRPMNRISFEAEMKIENPKIK